MEASQRSTCKDTMVLARQMRVWSPDEGTGHGLIVSILRSSSGAVGLRWRLHSRAHGGQAAGSGRRYL